MIRRSLAGCGVLLVWLCLGVEARAEQVAPRDIWPQATAAADAGDFDTAYKKTNELSDIGGKYGIKTFPVYATSAVAMARQAAKKGNKLAADWGNKAADQLDPNSPGVAFSKADEAGDQRDWAHAIPSALRGFGRTITEYRAQVLSRS